MKTTFHLFHFDMREPGQAEAWAEFKDARKAGPECMGPVSADHYTMFKHLDGQMIELETKYLFSNQWDTPPMEGADKGYRVFDYTLEHQRHNYSLKRGHWLEQTDEMRDIRRNTVRCGWCGHQEVVGLNVFCPACIDSQYLKEEDLSLLRLVPVDGSVERRKLRRYEYAVLRDWYIAAQIKGETERGIARINRLKEDIRVKYQKKIANAEVEYNGYMWLIQYGFGQLAADNVLFYGHTGRFSFGWRTPLGGGVLSRLLDAISEFTFPYDIKTDDGRTLSGN